MDQFQNDCFNFSIWMVFRAPINSRPNLSSLSEIFMLLYGKYGGHFAVGLLTKSKGFVGDHESE
jgi:hypothetical protein